MKTSDEAFIESVQDHLAGTPNARHPVQFDLATIPSTLDLFACSLCKALVLDQEGHRSWHDEHNRVHREIERPRR